MPPTTPAQGDRHTPNWFLSRHVPLVRKVTATVPTHPHGQVGTYTTRTARGKGGGVAQRSLPEPSTSSGTAAPSSSSGWRTAKRPTDLSKKAICALRVTLSPKTTQQHSLPHALFATAYSPCIGQREITRAHTKIQTHARTHAHKRTHSTHTHTHTHTRSQNTLRGSTAHV